MAIHFKSIWCKHCARCVQFRWPELYHLPLIVLSALNYAALCKSDMPAAVYQKNFVVFTFASARRLVMVSGTSVVYVSVGPQFDCNWCRLIAWWHRDQNVDQSAVWQCHWVSVLRRWSSLSFNDAPKLWKVVADITWVRQWMDSVVRWRYWRVAQIARWTLIGLGY